MDVGREWAEAVLSAAAAREERLPAVVDDSRTVLRDPATTADVEALEARIGRRLPPSYRRSLLTSDGARAQPGWGPPVLVAIPVAASPTRPRTGIDQ